MTCNQKRLLSITMVVILSSLSAPAWTGRSHHQEINWNNDWGERHGYFRDRRYGHNRYYPRPGHRFKFVPRGHIVVPYAGLDYFLHGGSWYQNSGTGFSVVIPPFGLFVTALPRYYTTLRFNDIPYYYAGGVYYKWQADRNGYVTTKPPRESEQAPALVAPEPLVIYPKKGQPLQRQADDRYQCHRWAREQTGFDPTQPGGKVPASEYTAKRTEYYRATRACLEGREYSVR